jgi:hypothetical protein
MQRFVGLAFRAGRAISSTGEGKPMVSDDPSGERPPLVPNYVHVVRTAQAMHLSLSQMADQKASILMGATFVIFTLAIGQAKGGFPPAPLAILGGFAFVSAILAVSVVMPSLQTRRSDPEAPVNLLFFGSFVRLSENEFVEALRVAVQDDNDAMEIMARDLYQNGQVLAHKKYRLLGYAYRVLLIGLVASLGGLIWEAARPYLA